MNKNNDFEHSMEFRELLLKHCRVMKREINERLLCEMLILCEEVDRVLWVKEITVDFL